MISCRHLTRSTCLSLLTQDGNQEDVLTNLVGAFLLRIVSVWECDEDPTQAARSAINESVSEDSSRCMLHLILNSCWKKTPALRQRQMEILAALMGRKSRRPSEKMLAAISGHLEHPQTQEQECCEILSLVSHVVRAFSDVNGKSPRVTPFSRREKFEGPSESLSKLAALAFPLALANIEDERDSVRLQAVQTLEGFLSLIRPDSTGSEADTSTAINSDRYTVYLLDMPSLSPDFHRALKSLMLFRRWGHPTPCGCDL